MPSSSVGRATWSASSSRSYSLNQHQSANESTITIVCERATVRLELHRHAWRWMERPDTEWREEACSVDSRDAWFTMQAESWIDAVVSKRPPLCSLAEGIQTLRVNIAALASLQAGGRWMTVASPDQETPA